MNDTYEPVIGLEIHVELATKSKMFCQCRADWFGMAPNTNTCPVCLALPGALPVPNHKAVEYTIKIAYALGCTVHEYSHFDRKHYFYPDLPKGYQISQYDEPIGVQGGLEVEVKDPLTGEYIMKKFRIHRVHLEEDTGKLIHTGDESQMDFNRSGVPLVEIVTEADFHSSEDVKVFLQELHTIVRYLDVSTADMEKGSMRLEPNISVRKKNSGEKLPPYKVEVKNINSFNFAKKAIDYEVERHIEILETGKFPPQETRGWDEKGQKTYAQRSKENAHDYRYFPEPDIPPLRFDPQYLAGIKANLPALPGEKYADLQKKGVTKADAQVLVKDTVLLNYFELIMSDLASDTSFTQANPNNEKKIASMLTNKKISSTDDVAKSVATIKQSVKPMETDSVALNVAVVSVAAAQPKAVAEYKSGKEATLMFLVGQVMKEMKGKADASVVKQALIEYMKTH